MLSQVAASVSALSDRTFHRAQPIAALGLALGNETRCRHFKLRSRSALKLQGDGQTEGGDRRTASWSLDIADVYYSFTVLTYVPWCRQWCGIARYSYGFSSTL